MGYPSFNDITKGFAPGWFASVMGTGVLALTTLSIARDNPWLEGPAWVLHYFNLLLFATLAVPWVLRWVRFPEAALATLRHPLQANFYPTFSIAVLVIALQWLHFGHHVELALAFWWVGALLTYGFSFAILLPMFRGEQVTLDHVTPAKYIPAVGLVVMPLAGGPLLATLEGSARDLALLMNVMGLGAGAMTYLALLSLVSFRKYLHKPALGILTPTVWIQLAPIGVIPLSLLNLTEQLPFAAAREVAQVVALLVWGFGVWWLIMAVFMTLAAKREGQLPFALSWWAFTFPLGAFVSLSLRLGKTLDFSPIHCIGVFAWALLVGLWLITLSKTLHAVKSGKVFQPHP